MEDIQVYEVFCENFESQLRSSEDNEAKAYADEVGKTVAHIKTGTATPQAVQEEVLDHLVKAGVPEETRDAIEDEPLLNKQQVGAIVKTSVVVLAIASVVLTATGVLSPVGAAALAAIHAAVDFLAGLGTGSMLDKKDETPKLTCDSFKEHMEHDRAEDPEVRIDLPSKDVDTEKDAKEDEADSENMSPG